MGRWPKGLAGHQGVLSTGQLCRETREWFAGDQVGRGSHTTAFLQTG